MANDLTELIFVLDRSGSMSGLEDSTIKGYNDFLAEQATLPGELKVTTVLFDSHYKMLFDGVPAAEAKLNSQLYRTQGCTALYDAVGRTIVDVSVRLATLPEQQKPQQVIMVITTDGYENSSTDFSKREVKALIKKQEEAGWKFLFFGANIDAADAAETIGIKRDDAVQFEASEAGVKACYARACGSVKAMRSRR
ncbi:MAG: VWA domain-containing protein [Coriobacteriales bacterium]|nr:VWA domain-containing protein [Coriobacteriales bacterium]